MNRKEDILNQSIQDRLDYFENKVCAHPLLKEAVEKTMEVINVSHSGDLLLIFGPSGVGKSTLIRQVVKQTIEQSYSNEDKDPGQIPIVFTEAVAPDHGNFDYGDLYKRLLVAMEEPLIDYKINYGTKNVLNKSGKIVVSGKVVKSDLRFALEKALFYRKPRAVIIDEAQHLTKVAGGRKLQDNLDTLKSLANMSNTLLVLVGTYELLPFRDLSGQLSRRTIDIHFPRYHYNVNDLNYFGKVVEYFLNQLPLEETPSLTGSDDILYFYKKTIGCIGTLKRWFCWTLSSALQRNAKTLALEDFERYALSYKQCSQMIEDAMEGENRVYNDELVAQRIFDTKFETSAQVEKQQAKKKINSKKRVGQRNPVRDPIGGCKNVN